MLLFLLSASIGVWAAYNRVEAWAKFFLLIGAVFLYYALAGQPTSNLWLIVGVLGFSGVIVGGYFLLTHDWQTFPAKIRFINRILLHWQSLRPALNLPALPPNVAASLMAMSMPLLVAWAIHNWQRGLRTAVLVAVIACGIVLSVLLLSTSRGAWLALFTAAGIGLLAWLSRPLARRIHRPRRVVFVLLLVLVAIFVALVTLLYPGGPVALLNQLPGPASATDRYTLSQGTLDLIRDFPFTGGGLRSFPGLYSQYILSIPVFFLPNGHNIFLDVALEQGPLGAISMTIIFLGSFILLIVAPRKEAADHQESERNLTVLRFAIAASLIIMLLHGLVEDTVYGSQAALFLFALPGLAVAASLPQEQVTSLPVGYGGWVVGSTLLTFAILAGFWFIATRQSPVSTWQANLGAITMARAELAEWPTNEWDDGSNIDALLPAEVLFESSLIADPGNRTAHHRLGMVAMLRRDYERAINHLETADQLGRPHQGIRKMLAYSYVWAGRFEEAQHLLAEIPEARSEMGIYSWWWKIQGRDDLAAFAEQIVVLSTADDQPDEEIQ